MIAAVASPAHAGSANASQDEYTLYELLAPASASFKITYEVTATSSGAKAFWNPIRKGSVASDEAVFDVMTGAPLPFAQVSGAQAKAHGMGGAELDSDYIEVHLARPVPADGGQARLRIVKTYQDAKSYFAQGDAIVFDRPLGIRRNAIVLPAGYQLTAGGGGAAGAGPDRARATRRARAPGSRHRLLPAGAPDQRVRALPRLHRV